MSADPGPGNRISCYNENPRNQEAEFQEALYITHTWALNRRLAWENSQMKTAIAITFFLGTAIAATAHLGPLTEPKAEATYRTGTTLAIKWSVSVPHGTQDLAYSKANGPWVSITTGLSSRIAAHNWTIPAAAEGGNIRIRVCQRDGGGGCTDAHNTNSPGSAIRLPAGGSVYTLIGGNFTVSAPTSIRPASALEGASLAFRPESRSVEVAFSLATPERVTLEAFDAQGKRLAVLLDDHMAVGRHTLSVFSHALDVTIPMILRLQAGGKVLQQALEAR